MVSLCAGLDGNLTLFELGLLLRVPSPSLCVMSKKLMFCYRWSAGVVTAALPWTWHSMTGLHEAAYTYTS